MKDTVSYEHVNPDGTGWVNDISLVYCRLCKEPVGYGECVAWDGHEATMIIICLKHSEQEVIDYLKK